MSCATHKPAKSHRETVCTQIALVGVRVVRVEGSDGTHITINCTAIDYAHGCSPMLLDYLPLEEGASLAWFFISFFGFYRLMSISAVGRCDKRIHGTYL